MYRVLKWLLGALDVLVVLLANSPVDQGVVSLLARGLVVGLVLDRRVVISDTLASCLLSASIVLGGVTERVIFALNSTVHGSLASVFLGVAVVETGTCLRLSGGLGTIFTSPTFFVSGVGGGLLVQVPAGVHHLVEVSFVINTCGHVSVVFDELSRGDFAIGLVSLVLLEGVQELFENLTFGLAAVDDSGVLLGVVRLANVSVVDLAVTVLVKNCVSFLDQFKSVGVEVTTNFSQELVVLEGTISVLVECFEHEFNVVESDVKLALLDTLDELGQVQSLRVVVVHDLEDAADSDNGAGTSDQQFLSEGSNKLFSPAKIKI